MEVLRRAFRQRRKPGVVCAKRPEEVVHNVRAHGGMECGGDDEALEKQQKEVIRWLTLSMN